MHRVLYLPCTPSPMTVSTSESGRARCLALMPETAAVRMAVMYVASIMVVGKPACMTGTEFTQGGGEGEGGTGGGGERGRGGKGRGRGGGGGGEGRGREQWCAVDLEV